MFMSGWECLMEAASRYRVLQDPYATIHGEALPYYSTPLLSPSHAESSGPKIVADHTNRLSSDAGDAEHPCSTMRDYGAKPRLQPRAPIQKAHPRAPLTSGGEFRMAFKSLASLSMAAAPLEGDVIYLWAL